MTIVNHTSATHSGLLVTGKGDDIEVDLEIVGGRTLRMSAAGDELGAWPVDECRIEPDPSSDGSFRLVVDGEDAGFTPAEPGSFQALVERVMESDDEDLHADHGDEESTGGSAADDPVAFLFGSTPPPTPATTELPDFDTVDEDWGTAAEVETQPDATVEVEEIVEVVEIEAVEEIEEDEEAVEEVEEGEAAAEVEATVEVDAVDEAVEVEEVETVTAGAAWETPAEPTPEPEEPLAELDAEAHLSEPSVDSLFAQEASTPDWMDFEEEGVDAATEDQPVGGGSALSRLSAAIGSLRSTDSKPEPEDDDGQYSVGPNTVASDILETQRSLREHQLKEIAKGKWLRWGGIAVATAAVIALFAFLTPRAIDFLQSYESDIAPPPEVANTTIPPTTAPTATPDTAPVDTTPEALPIGGEEGTIFDRPSPEFITRWDAAGGEIDDVLTFDGFPQLGPFEERFTPFLAMNGIVQPDGTLDQFTLVIDPTGPAEYDRIGIQALGVAIATVDPERSPEGRASLLGELGLNVRQPLLEGIDGTAEAAGIAYTLVYDAAANLLTMTVTPVS